MSNVAWSFVVQREVGEPMSCSSLHSNFMLLLASVMSFVVRRSLCWSWRPLQRT
jgi:hypothetical protein